MIKSIFLENIRLIIKNFIGISVIETWLTHTLWIHTDYLKSLFFKFIPHF